MTRRPSAVSDRAADREAVVRAVAPARFRSGAALLALVVGLYASCAEQAAIPSKWTESSVATTPLASGAGDARPASEFGTLKLTLKTPDGAEWTGACSVLATPIAGGSALQITDPLQRGPTVEALLAPGRWRLHFESEEPVHSCCVKPPEFSRYGGIESECEIRKGETTALEVRLRAGGRLNLTIALPAGVEHAEIDEIRALPECDRRARVVELSAKSESRVASVSLEKTAGSPARQLSFLVPCCSKLTLDRPLLGLTWKSETFFDPGPLALRVEAPGFEPLTTAVAIEAGRDADVSVSLKPLAVAK